MTRTYEDFEWLQQHLFSQEDVPGIQGVIVSNRTGCFLWTAAAQADECWKTVARFVIICCCSLLFGFLHAASSAAFSFLVQIERQFVEGGSETLRRTEFCNFPHRFLALACAASARQFSVSDILTATETWSAVGKCADRSFFAWCRFNALCASLLVEAQEQRC